MATAIRKPTYVTVGGASSAGGGNGRPYRPAHRPEVTYMVREPPVVYPYDDAVVHHNFKGDQFEGVFIGGVYKGLGYEVDSTNGIFTLKPGYGSIWGREFEIDDDHEIDMSALTGTKYCIVYVEINLEDFTTQFASIKLAYAGANYPDIESKNLIEYKSGIARMVLYSFIYTAANHGFSNMVCKFYNFSAGVAEHARMMKASDKWNNRELQNLFYYNADRFKKGSKTVYADLAKSIGTSGAWVATSDELEVKHADEDFDRQLVKVTKGSFHVSLDKASKGSGTKKFYYSLDENPIPYGATVIGVIVGGTMRGSEYGSHQYFTPQHEVHETKIFGWVTGKGHVPADEGQYMYRGELYSSYKKFEIKGHMYQADHIIGTEVGWNGVILCDPEDLTKVDCGDGHMTNFSYGIRGTLATLKFQGLNEKRPYIQVTMGNFDGTLSCELYFRLLYIKGEEKLGRESQAYDNWDTQHQFPYTVWGLFPDTNPFLSLDPSLEGGQT